MMNTEGKDGRGLTKLIFFNELVDIYKGNNIFVGVRLYIYIYIYNFDW